MVNRSRAKVWLLLLLSLLPISAIALRAQIALTYADTTDAPNESSKAV